MVFTDPLRANESVLFDGEVTKIKSLVSITQGTGTVTNQRCLFHWGNEKFAAEKGELTSLAEQKHGFGTKILVQKNGESVVVMAANMKGLKSSLYALAGMQFDEAALKQPELSTVKNTTAWIAALGPILASLTVVLFAAIMGWNLDNASGMAVVKLVIFRVVLIYTFMRIDYLSLQAQGYNTNALGIVPPEQFPIYLFSRAKAFGHSKSYAITWCVLIGIDILVMFA